MYQVNAAKVFRSGKLPPVFLDRMLALRCLCPPNENPQLLVVKGQRGIALMPISTRMSTATLAGITLPMRLRFSVQLLEMAPAFRSGSAQRRISRTSMQDIGEVSRNANHAAPASESFGLIGDSLAGAAC